MSVLGKQYEMTEQLVDTEGTRYYDASFNDVYIAAEAALGSLGFQIGDSEPATGRIVTEERAQNTEASGTSVARMYFTITVDIEIIEAKRTKVRVYPRRYVGMEKIESYQLWEHGWLETHWTGLFNDIAARVSAPPLRPDQIDAEQQAAAKKDGPLVIGE